MIKRRVILTASILFSVFITSVLCENVFASDFVESTTSCPSPAGMTGTAPKNNGYFDCAIVNGHHDTKSGGTYFDIDLRESGVCKEVDCRVVGKFVCITSGGWYLTDVNNSKTEVTKIKTEDNWDYYEIKLHSAGASWYSGHTIQDVKGKIKVKHKTTKPNPPTRSLKIQKIDIESLDYLGGKITAGSFTEDGKTHTLTWTNNDVSGYKFIGFKTADHEESGTDHIIERTDYGKYKTYVSDAYSSGVVYYKYNNDNPKTIYKTVHAKLKNSSRTILAFYAKQYSLSINNDHTTISVKRKLSDYAKRTMIDEDSNLYEYDYLDICARADAGYTFKELKINGTKKTPYGDCDGGKAYWFEVHGDTTISASAEKNEFQGLSRAADANNNSDNKSTGWVKVSTTADNYVKTCDDPANGCPVVIAQHLKRVAGSGTTSYSFSVDKSYGVADGVADGGGGDLASAGNNTDVTVRRTKYLLKPGQKVCETMKFKPVPADSTEASLKTCAYAVGSTATNLYLSIKNESVTKYSTYGNGDVYAKPGDKIKYRVDYSSLPQYAYGIVPERIQINSGSIYPSTGANTNRFFGKFNTSNMLSSAFKYYGSSDWGNGFSFKINNVQQDRKDYTGGEMYPQTNPVYYDYDNVIGVHIGDVGKSIEGRATTNPSGETKITPKNITFYMNGDFNVGKIDTNDLHKEVYARVPYNFENSTEILSNASNTTLYAGEDATIRLNYIIGVKGNSETTNASAVKYITSVDNPKWQVGFCVGEAACNAGEYDSHKSDVQADDSGKFRVGINEMYANKTISNRPVTINVPDVSAGTQICIKSFIYPENSGSDMNYSDSKGNDKWTDSGKRECFRVAKRPSFQVWGGNVYSAKDIKTSVAKKHINGTVRSFGSWTELGLMANGTVTGMASGAGLGYGNNSSVFENGVWPGYHPTQWGNKGNNNVPGDSYTGGGKGGESFCLRSTLTFANEGCNNSAGFKGTGSIDSGEDRHNLISDFVPGDKTKYSLDGDEFSWYALNNDNIVRLNHHVQDSEVEYYYDSANEGGLSVSFQYYNTIIPVKRESNRGMYTNTIVIDSERDVHLMSNIYYENGSYTSIEDIPKVIIYSEKNISIDCSVQRIDAVLIAKGDINTCYSGEKNEENYNGESNSNQLIINGATISNTLTLNRTYGAATVFNSIIPAEIINYDTSLYLWANKQTNVTGSGTMKEASVRELAPRY